jgi:hypothetical protein
MAPISILGAEGGQPAVTMKIMPNRHPHEDVFEGYAFDRLSAQELIDFEEHLLICEKCQSTLAKTDEYIRLMKAATAAYIAESSSPLRRRGLRRNVAAAAVLLLTCLTALLSLRTPPGDPHTIQLEAYRGKVSVAPAGVALNLKIDLPKLELKDERPAAAYRVEVVDGTGRRVWFGGVPVYLTGGLAAGTYWVRLSSDTGELLREFGIRAENR